jgi:ribosomal protein L40E
MDMGRKKVLFFTLMVFLLLTLLFAASVNSVQGIDLYLLDKEEIVENEPVRLSFTTFSDTREGIEDVRIVVDEMNIDVNHTEPTYLNGTGWVVYCEVDISFQGGGRKEIEVQHLFSGEWTTKDILEVNVKGTKEDDEDTILGLPRWYCSVSIIITTLLAIFFTWSYFKGRKMKREMEERENDLKVQCSECGKDVGLNDRTCPWCGVSLDEDEFICGKCGTGVSGEDEKCKKCGTRLEPRKKPGTATPLGKKDDLEKKKKVDTKDKRTCRDCGAVLMKNEKVCPVCGK